MQTSKLVTWKQLKDELGIPFSRTHVYRLISEGKFPTFIRLGQARVVWRLQEILDWIEQRAKDTLVPAPDSD